MTEETIYTTKTAAEYLGLHWKTVQLFAANPDIPLTGEKLNKRNQIFRQIELDQFKQWLADHPEHSKRGRPVGWRKHPGKPGHKLSRADLVVEVPVMHQNIADALKRIVIETGGRNAPELGRIKDFERLPWYGAEAMRQAAGVKWQVGDTFMWAADELPTAADVVALIDAYEAAL